MRHKLSKNKLSRSSSQRKALLRNLVSDTIRHGKITTTKARAKEARPILEKIITYESVHEIENWDDLRRRLQPDDRRCFAFFHPAMPDEPLIFVEVALTEGTPDSIQKIKKP